MILSPLQDTAMFGNFDWIRVKPRITQKFGLNPQMYKQFKMKGHNGIDFGIPVGTPIFSPCDGIITVKDSGKKGYGLHVRIKTTHKPKEIVLGHFSRIVKMSNTKISVGDYIGLSGNTGFSTGAHLHLGMRRLGEQGKLVSEYDNGYYGYIDPIEYMICWKGTLTKNTLET